MLVEAFIAQPSVEALDEGVLDRLARRDVMPSDAGILREAQDRAADQLRAVVRDDHARLTAPGHDLRKFTHDTSARERCVGHQPRGIRG